MKGFKVVSDFDPKGDQPQAIKKIAANLNDGLLNQTLLGVTGSGKTYTIAKVIEETQRPAIIMAPNKTLAAQLMASLKIFSQIIELSTSFHIMIIINPKLTSLPQILI
tara:strand:- start:201 stop:524 length:324 start_codon:yes stop_codon:yes gene_type:complete